MVAKCCHVQIIKFAIRRYMQVIIISLPLFPSKLFSIVHFNSFFHHLILCLDSHRSRVNPLKLLAVIPIHALLEWSLPIRIYWGALRRCCHLLWRVCGSIVCAWNRRELLNRWWRKWSHRMRGLRNSLLNLCRWLLVSLHGLLYRISVLWCRWLRRWVRCSLRMDRLWSLLLKSRSSR